MKRTFTQKVKQVPTCAADSINMLLKLYVGKHSVSGPMPTEVNRRACTSAAMIGLAISMSATGLLLAQQSDEAMAVEPVAAEPTSPTSASEQSTSVSQASAGDLGGAASATAPRAEKQAPVIEHKVKQGETLWGLSKSYEVRPEAIAASNAIKPSADLPVGQKLKIPSVNGIVHEVKTGETVETLSKSYGVKPTQLQASAAVSESGQLKTGESVTVPGNVNDLLKAKQDVALNNLKEKRNRLNDSLAELRSEESINLSKSKTVLKEELAAVPQLPPVTVSPGMLKSQEQLANTPQPMASVPTSPVVVPVPTPDIAFSPAVEQSPTGQSNSSVVIPVPTPEVSLSPTVEPSPARQSVSSVVIPVPTPEAALSPTVAKSPARQSVSSVAIPVPTPEVAFSPAVEKKAQTVPSLPIAPVTPLENAAKPQVPQPVVMQPLVAPTDAKVYEVKPGDTVEAIARRNGLSSSQVIQANGLSNPNLLRINQQLRIPKAQSSSNAAPTVALLPGIKPNNSSSSQQPRGVSAPTLAEPTFPEQVTPVVQTEQLSASRSVPRAVLAQSTVVSSASPKPVVVVDTKESQPANSGSNPYIDQLRADILRMRQEYQQRKEGDRASTARTIAVPSVTTPTVSGLNNNGSTSSRINPDFNPKQPNETLNAGLDRRSQPLQKGPIPIEVPPPEAGPSGRPDLLATGPAPADSYNPAVRTPVGQRVSPELPPLSSPDRYLPGNPAQFSNLIWPTKGVLTSGYGWRWGRMHRGIDIAAPIGTPVVAAAPGVVVSAGWNSGGYGNLVEIQHPDGSVTVYAHNNRILVRRGQEVAQGEQISEMGSTGRSTGPHCHFEVHPPGRGAVNPIAFLPRR